jgi:hypothetical protein
MKESHGERLATYIGPETCGATRKGRLALTLHFGAAPV